MSDWLTSLLFNVNRPSLLKIWPWESMVKTMCVVKGQAHFVGWATYQFTSFSFHSYLKLDLENPRSRSWPRSKLMAIFEAWCSTDTLIFRFLAIGSFCQKTQQIDYLTMKIQGQGHGQGQTYRSGSSILTKMKEIQKAARQLSHVKICDSLQRRRQ